MTRLTRLLARWRSEPDPCAETIAAALGEPLRTARDLAHRSECARRERRTLYERLASSDESEVRAECARVEFEDPGALRAARALGPAVWLTMHMGPFYLGMFRLAAELPERPIALIKAERPNDTEAAAYSHLSRDRGALTLLRHDDTRTVRRAVRALQGGSLLATFADVPPGYGPTMPGRLFGRPAELASGPVRIALAAGVPVVPWCTWRDDDAIRVSIAGPLERRAAENRASALSRMTAALWQRMEDWIRARPDQWQLWPVVAASWGEAHDVGAVHVGD